MDMRQLIAQIDHIENKQILNEDAHYTAAPVDNRPRVSKSNNQTSIYEMLIKEFGYELDERVTINPDGTTSGGLFRPQPAAAPAAAAPTAGFTPEQQAKMGQANPQDPYIVARVLGKDAVPLSYFTSPEDQAIAKRLGFKDAPAAAAAPAAPAGGAAQPTAAPAAPDPTQPANPMAGAKPPAPAAAPDAAAQASRIADRMDAEAGASGAGQTPTVATPQAQQDAQNRSEPSAAGSKEQMASIMNMQKELDVNQDGKIGPKTRDAMARKPEIAAKYAGELGGAKQFPGVKPAGSAAQPATKPGAPNQSDAETARLARQNAALAAGNAAKAQLDPRGKPLVKDKDGNLGYFNNPNVPSKGFTIVVPAASNAAKPAATGSAASPAAPTTSGGRPYTPPAGAAQPAATKSTLPGVTGVPGAQISDTPAAESVKSQDDAILERIRKALYR